MRSRRKDTQLLSPAACHASSTTTGRNTGTVPQFSRQAVALAIMVVLVLGSASALTLSDAGLPIPAAAVLVAVVICLLAIIATGIFGYRSSRDEGRGFWRSIAGGLRTAGRTLFDLF